MARLRYLFATLGCLAFAATAQAGSITTVTWDDCDSQGCEGSTLSLSVEDLGGGMHLATYTIDATGYTGNRMGFNQVGWKAVTGWSDAEVVFATNGTGSWSDVIESSISSNSLCDHTNGATGKTCLFGFVDITGGGEYTWVVKYTDGTLLDTDSWHLGAQYANPCVETQGKIISVSGSPPIPEPSAALLFAAGAMVVSAHRRRF